MVLLYAKDVPLLEDRAAGTRVLVRPAVRAYRTGGRPWQQLARRKVEELRGRIAELEQTTALLRSAVECGCRSLETCGRAAHLATLGRPG